MFSVVPSSAAAAPSQTPALKFITVFGQQIAYIEAGAGSDLVLLHGLGSSADGDWGRVIPELAKMRALHDSGALFPIASLASSAALQKQVFASPDYQTVQGVKGAFAWSMGNGDAWTTSSITQLRRAGPGRRCAAEVHRDSHARGVG